MAKYLVVLLSFTAGFLSCLSSPSIYAALHDQNWFYGSLLTMLLSGLIQGLTHRGR